MKINCQLMRLDFLTLKIVEPKTLLVERFGMN